jgi:hypothetical protein
MKNNFNCTSCGKGRNSGDRFMKDGRCRDCHRHPPFNKWKGGTIPEGCELYVMPAEWKQSEIEVALWKGDEIIHQSHLGEIVEFLQSEDGSGLLGEPDVKITFA